MRADPIAAIGKFNEPDGSFRDRDLYVFCAGVGDGRTTAHPSLIGDDLRQRKDKNGKAFGAEILAVAREGTFSEVTYMWPRPGGTEPVEKISRVTRIGDQICGVGYYKE
jgi:signal transduction histidine kinase